MSHAATHMILVVGTWKLMEGIEKVELFLHKDTGMDSMFIKNLISKSYIILKLIILSGIGFFFSNFLIRICSLPFIFFYSGDSILQFICLLLHIGLLTLKMQEEQSELFGILLEENCLKCFTGARNWFRGSIRT